MKFRTELPIPQYSFAIGPSHRLMFLGSCFSEHISKYFRERRFSVCANPFGILFNPFSIALALDLMTGKEQLSEHYYAQYNDKWISFAHHGRFSHPDRERFEQNIESSLHEAMFALQKSDYLFITLGTSFYYYHKEKQMVVANCHKVPAAAFEKRRAGIEEIVSAFSPFFAWQRRNIPSMKVIFTVSPVRHLGDGFHENQLSKSILHLAIEEIVCQNENAFYFPVYELFNDDLRDYRFYASDLCHPAQPGIDYVQEFVSRTFFTEETRAQIAEIEKENKRMGHIEHLVF